MGSKERREREKEELRGRIMTAAREMFATEGYEAVTMRKIASKIEYSPTAIYLHFADKDALMRELCTEDFSTLYRAFEKFIPIKDPLERLRKVAQAYVAFSIDHPNQY